MNAKRIDANRSRYLERIVKGYANHWRIAMMVLLANEPELSLEAISAKLGVHMKTASEHLRRLTIAGHVIKRHDGHNVRHKLTPRGMKVLKFLRTLE